MNAYVSVQLKSQSELEALERLVFFYFPRNYNMTIIIITINMYTDDQQYFIMYLMHIIWFASNF